MRLMDVNFTGTWIADIARSKFRGPTPKSTAMRIRHAEPELYAEVETTKADGATDRATFTCRTTGEADQSRFNSQPVRGNARWEGRELLIETWMQIGPRELHFRDFWWLSPDGQTLFMEHREDDLAGQFGVLNRVK